MALTDKIIKIADKTRELTGLTDKMTLEEIPSNMDLIKAEPNLQDKSIEITENGTRTITADEGYDGLSNVEITTNAIENLEQELSNYNTGLNTQETSIETIVEALSSKGFYEKYAPRHISFNYYTGVELNKELSNIDFSNITSAKYMFANSENLTSLDLSSFNTNKITDFNSMFQACKSLTELDLSNFDTSNVTNMSNMFNVCTALKNIKLSNFNTSKVTNMMYFFRNCSSLTELDLSNFDTSNVTNMYGMFQNCTSLSKLDIRNFDFTKVNNSTNIFQNVPYDCEIIVKDDTAKEWIKNRVGFSNIKTVAELEG